MYHKSMRKHCFRPLDVEAVGILKQSLPCIANLIKDNFNVIKSRGKKPTILPGFRPGESHAKESQSRTLGWHQDWAWKRNKFSFGRPRRASGIIRAAGNISQTFLLNADMG